VTDEAPQELRWTRLLAVGLLALLVVETGARLFVHAWSGESFRSLTKYTWSPYGLVRNNPELNSPGFQINANGFRNLEDFDERKGERTLRVLLLGGSVLYSGLGGPRILAEEGRVTSGETIAQYLEARLSADPMLAGIDVEVMNAAVNFNRIVEISTSYLAEWVFWDPDVVVVCGSANNVFGFVPPRDEVQARLHGAQAPHPWALDYQRMVVEKSLRSLIESTLRVAEEHLASVAMARLAVTKAVDRFWSAAQARRLGGEGGEQGAAPELASAEEIEAYFRDYAGYVEALVPAAQHHDQEVAFFWEYFLGNLKGIKPFSEREAWLYPAVERPDSGRAYNFAMRDRLRDLLAARGVPLIDPLPELRQHDQTVFIDYLHYTRSGNAFMADVIYDRLKPVFHARAAKLR
jgi:lysophospholipase L1-like esterase